MKILSVLAVILIAGTAESNHCNTVVQEKVVVNQVYIPVAVLVPAYQFQYSAPCVTQAPQHFQPTPAQAPGQHEPNIEDGPPAAINSPDSQIFQTPAPINPPNVPPGVPKGMSKEQAGPLATAALIRNCSACHTGSGSRNGEIIFAQPRVFNANANWKAIKKEVSLGRMPPARETQFRLTDEERTAILVWLSDF